MMEESSSSYAVSGSRGLAQKPPVRPHRKRADVEAGYDNGGYINHPRARSRSDSR